MAGKGKCHGRHTAASQPHHPGAAGCNQKLPVGSGDVCAVARARTSPRCSTCLSAQTNFLSADLSFASGLILLLLKGLAATRDAKCHI